MPFFPRSLAINAARFLAVAAMLPALASCYSYGVVVGDNDPHPAVARARTLPIQGLDVSRYQGDIDFDAARAAGTHFVFMKATEGSDWVDPAFRRNWRGAQAAGMPRGAYHFMTWCSLAREQADWFTANVPADIDALPPVLDLEWNHSSSCKKKFSKADTLEKIHVMLEAMERHTGKLPIIYTDIPFYRDILEGEHFDNTIWLRSVAAEPQQRYDTHSWTFWQWTSTGTMPGVKGEVDRNAFYGTQDEWVHFLLTGCDPRVTEYLSAYGRCRSWK